MKHVRILLVLGVAVLGIVALRFTLFRERAVAVETARASSGPVEDVVTNSESGTVRSRAQARLASEGAGRVASPPAREGTVVHRGDVLLALDRVTEDARTDAARRDLEAADAVHQSAHAAQRLAALSANRAERLQAMGQIAQEQFDEARARRDVANADLAAAEARVASARAALRVARDEQGHRELLAPFDGVVTRRFVEQGETVVPGQPVIEVMDPDSLYVRCPIDERDAGRLVVGLPVRVTIDTYPGVTWRGRLAWVAPLVEEAREQNRTLAVEVDLPPDPSLPAPRPGMTADVEIVLDRRDAAVRVPSVAVLDGRRVYVVRGGRAVARDVTTGLKNWDWTEIRSGLAAGETVVTTLDRPGLKPGVRVQATPAK